MHTTTLKGIAVVSALTVGAMALATPAEAGRRHHRHHGNHGGTAAAIVLGLGAAAIIAGSHRRHNYYNYGHAPRYYAPRRSYYYSAPPRPYYGPTSYSRYAPAPWTPAWYNYCSSKYRSFDPRSGTFQPYNGPRRLCT
jgi:hypothetical protein